MNQTRIAVHGIPFTELPWAVIDVEAANPGKVAPEIIEVAIHRYLRGEQIDRYETYVKPEMVLDGKACIGHSVRARHVAGAPRFAEIVDDVRSRLSGCVVVGHALPNDVKFLNKELSRAGAPKLGTFARFDTQTAWERLQFCERGRLKDLAAHFEIERTGKLHTAAVDAELTAKVALRIAEMMEPAPVLVVGEFNPDPPVGPRWTLSDVEAAICAAVA